MFRPKQIMRLGKTQRDRQSGAASRAAGNRILRAAALKNGERPPTCSMNGRRNSNPNFGGGR